MQIEIKQRKRQRQCQRRHYSNASLSRKNVAFSLVGSWLLVLSFYTFLLQQGSGPLHVVEAFLNCNKEYAPTTAIIPYTTYQQSKLLAVPDDSQSHSHSHPNQQTLVTTIAEDVWRAVAKNHRTTIQNLLQPGLVGLDHELMKPLRKQFKQEFDNQKNDASTPPPLTMLDPKHPIYNFLVEYYGLKGLKGPKRLARWAPSVGLFFWDADDDDNMPSVRRIESMQDYNDASRAYLNLECDKFDQDNLDRQIFLEGATPEDFALTLYLQGAEWVEPTESNDNNDHSIYNGKEGILYRPIRHYTADEQDQETKFMAHRKATSFVWYKSILENTLHNEPVLHCYGLHEWAMQYHPHGAPPPPSGKYQKHLPLRVSREIINQTVERKGLRCTHVDALRFFAPAAGPLNYHGASLQRAEQLILEQPGCVHAHMDLLKIALRIKPYCDPDLLVRVLETALEARTLDVGASPYDCSSYGYGSNLDPIRIIPVETTEGRALYQELQTDLMQRAETVRRALLANYEAFGALAFETQQLLAAVEDPTDERFAKAEPGGKAWRQNLIERPVANANDRNNH